MLALPPAVLKFFENGIFWWSCYTLTEKIPYTRSLVVESQTPLPPPPMLSLLIYTRDTREGEEEEEGGKVITYILLYILGSIYSMLFAFY